MNTSLYLSVSYEIKDYEVLLTEIDFEQPAMFKRIISSWCTQDTLQRPELWEVYIGKVEAETIGITGLYKLADTPTGIARLGWTGVRKKYIRQGYGIQLLNFMKERAKELNMTHLCVHTEASNSGAQSFYRNSGFELLSPHSKLREHLIFEPEDVAMICIL